MKLFGATVGKAFNKPVVMVGFGKDIKLIDLVKKIGTPEEESILSIKTNSGAIANYRELALATAEEIKAFIIFTTWLEKRINKNA